MSLAILKDIIRSGTLNRLKSHSAVQELTIESVNPDALVFGHWMGAIIVAGPTLQVLFKAHYFSADAKVMASMAFGKKSADITSAQAADFTKEFCNLVAGGIKQSLEKSSIDTGISLPMVIRGFDEVFTPLDDGVRTFHDFWRIKGSQFSITCSVLIEVADAPALERLVAPQESGAAVANDGDVDFL